MSFPLLYRNTITSFSWLSVDIIARAAEVAITPVRLGVSKPFGASSVTNEYQPTRLPTSLRFAADRNSGMRSLSRQLHIRSALPTTDPHGSHGGSIASSLLPLNGLKLQPQLRGAGGAREGEEGEGVDHDEFGMDLSDSDIPVSDHNESFDTSRGKDMTSYLLYICNDQLHVHVYCMCVCVFYTAL